CTGRDRDRLPHHVHRGGRGRGRGGHLVRPRRRDRGAGPDHRRGADGEGLRRGAGAPGRHGQAAGAGGGGGPPGGSDRPDRVALYTGASLALHRRINRWAGCGRPPGGRRAGPTPAFANRTLLPVCSCGARRVLDCPRDGRSDRRPPTTPPGDRMTPIARLSRVERPSLQHYETSRRKALEAVDAPDELPEALREMRVARAMLPRSAGPVVGWIDELLPLPDRGQPARTSPASTDLVWQKLARIDLTAGAVSVVASGVALTGLALWLTAALASGLGPRGALAILGAGLLVVGLVSLYLARRLVSYGAEHTGGAFRRWAGIEVCFGLAAAGAGAGGVLSLAGD